MFFDKYKALCDQNQVSCSKAASDMGLSNSTPTKWKRTGATPDAATLQKVADYFGISIADLIGDGPAPKKEKPVPNEDELDNVLIALLKELTPEEAAKAASFVQGLLAAREA